MMMRQIAICLAVVMACLAFVHAGAASEASTERSSLISLISENEDVHMTVQDLAFFLATHGYDATPKDGYVSVVLDKQVYHMTPNGAGSGLAYVAIVN